MSEAADPVQNHSTRGHWSTFQECGAQKPEVMSQRRAGRIRLCYVPKAGVMPLGPGEL